MKTLVEAIRRELKTQLAEVELSAWRGGSHLHG
jgi:hypothetical protein